MAEARELAGRALADALRESRARTLRWTFDLSDAQWSQVPQQPGVNLPAWELGHLAWFAEFWTLRGPHRLDGRQAAVPSSAPVHAGPDALFDSARMAHADRWSAELPSRAALERMLRGQLEATLEALDRIDTRAGTDDANLYFHRLALFHEDMHTEAFAWLRASLGYPAPEGACLAPLAAASRPSASLQFASASTYIGGLPHGGRGFAFDNELPGRIAELRDFEIDTQPVSAGRFLDFVQAGGYDDARWWPGPAGRWRRQQERSHPERWRRRPQQRHSAADPYGTSWEVRWFDRWQPLDPRQPVIHINAWEAEAWCLWAGRRLPRAAEWERAASTAVAGNFCWGRSVWEWMADDFLAYPGFAAGPYREYSAPWFDGQHRELRGGSFATHPRMHHPHYRNFFTPARSDVFAGFRSAAA